MAIEKMRQGRQVARGRAAARWMAAAMLLFLLAGMAAWNVHATTESFQDVMTGWQFRLLPGAAAARQHPQAAAWHPATVPGEVQTDLLANHMIPAPYYRDDEAKLQWIGLTNWEYRTTFRVTPATLRNSHVVLVFDGLDTFANVSLNGHPILAADNMFRYWRVPVRRLLHVGDNTLTVTLYSPIKRLQPWLLKQPYALPGEFDSAFGDEPKGKQTANYVRKAAYQYGWDWGPRFVTEGIWKPVRLDAWSTLRLADFHIAQPQVSAQVAHLRAEFEVRSDVAGKALLQVAWTAPDGRRQTAEQAVELHPGDNQLALPISIEHPQRWWPNGYGAPNMYRFDGTLSMCGQVLASATRETGLRSVVLLRRKDQWGRSFEFVINGVPIFAKGANVIPFDSFPLRVTPQRIEWVLKSAHDANMNMLRVWGGGYYETNAFYTMADKLGLMVWQEFMFGGAIPPYYKVFRDNTRIEAIQQVDRLRDHPSIVLWCGNNEVETAWESWGGGAHLEATLPKAEVQRIVNGMRELFDHTLRDVVQTQEPTVPYWPSSPSTDYEGKANQLDNGDYHSWNVWSGSAPIGQYLDTTPRFQSEYGLQSMPVMATIDSFTLPSDRSVDSPVMRAHQKFDHGNGNQRLLYYIRMYYGQPKNLASFIYLSQVMQAEGIQLAADHLRASRPQAMGSLYWQLNDVWPGITWSSIDYDGRWKALQYHARRFYAPLRVVAIRQHGRTGVWLVSDRTRPFEAQLRVRVIGMDGTPVWSHEQEVHVAALASTPAGDYTDAQLLHGADPRRSVAVFELLDHGKLLSRHLVYFARAKYLQLPDPGLTATLSADGRQVTVHAQRFAREVWIGFGAIGPHLSDNSFNLLPGESRTVEVDSTASAAALRKALHVRSLYGATVPTAATAGSP